LWFYFSPVVLNLLKLNYPLKLKMAETQTSETQFSQLLFGFNSIEIKTTLGLQEVKDISDYLKRRAAIEAEYAKKLTDLYKEKPGSGFFTKEPAILKEQTSLRTVLLSIQEKGLKAAEKHLEFANKINSEVCVGLENWCKTKEPERKKISIEGQKYLKNLADAKAVSSRAKAAFDASMKEAEVAQDQFEKAEKDEINQPDNKKLKPITQRVSAKFDQCKTKARSLDTSYRETIKKANDELEKFIKDNMPNVLNQFHKWEEDRWNILFNSTKNYVNLQENIPAALNDYVSELRTILNNSKIESDFKEFIEAASKESKEEKPLEYVPYAGKFSLETKEEQKPPSAEPKEEKKPEFSNLTAEEKLEQEKTQNVEDKSKSEEEVKKKAEAQRKADEIKANLFNTDQDLFKD